MQLNLTTDASFDLTRQEALNIISHYVSAREALTKLGILRTGRALQGDYAEWLLSKMYGLTLPENPVQAGWDATDAEGTKYQIKSRIVKNTEAATSFDLSEVGGDFDILLCCFLSETFDLLGVLQVSKEVVKELGSQVAKRFCFRWNRQISEDPRVLKLFWKNEAPDSRA